jgi:aspartate/methionine/tyrosine aminotransferase
VVVARTLTPFRLHDWFVENENEARISIGASGIPRAELAPYLPETKSEWERLWSTPADESLASIKAQLAAAYGFEERELLITQGASEADFAATFALANPGDRVAVERPAYFALVEPARALGCRVDRLRRLPPDFDLPQAALSTAWRKKPKLVLLARPNNPTGARVPDGELAEMAADARRAGAHVLVDEVFAEATPEGDRPARLAGDRILSVNSLTKCLGFGPLHVGWLAAPPAIAARAHRAKDHVRPLNPILGLGIAARILPHRAALLRLTRARRSANATRMKAWLREHPAMPGRVPAHGTTMVLRLPPGKGGDVAFAKRLLARHGVLAAPGSHVEMPGWLRIGLLAEPRALQAGLEAIAATAGV